MEDTMEKTAVLLINLGTPDAFDTASVRTYLKQFLNDRRVIDSPRWKWLPILHGIVLRVRPAKSAQLYESIWMQEGSPLLLYSKKQKTQLQARIESENLKVVLAMNYGNPSIADEMEKLHQWGVRKLIIVPLFPQYSSTTTASIWDSIQKNLSKWRDIPEVCFIRDFADHPKWIALLSKRIQNGIYEFGTPDAIVLSYHGIPVRYAQTGDDYPIRCQKTTAALQQQFPNLNFVESFQSKFGKEPWLEPSTSETVNKLAQNGKTNIHIIAPAFTAECLETLEELEVENRDIFMQAGGKQYHYLPAANDDALFIDCLEELVRPYL